MKANVFDIDQIHDRPTNSPWILKGGGGYFNIDRYKYIITSNLAQVTNTINDYNKPYVAWLKFR